MEVMNMSCIFMYIQLYPCVSMYVYVYLYIYISVYLCVFMCIYVYIYVYVCIYIYIYIYIRRPLWGHKACEASCLLLAPLVVLPVASDFLV